MKILQQTAWLYRCGGRWRCKETQLFMDSQLCTQTGVYCKCVFLLVHESLARVCVCAKMSSYQCRAAWDWMPKTSLERCTPPPRTIGCLDWLHWNGAGPEPHGSETSEGWKDNMFFYLFWTSVKYWSSEQPYLKQPLAPFLRTVCRSLILKFSDIYYQL